MALDAELVNLKSAGTYRFENDLSTISNDTTTYSNLRLVVGFSKIGPFNTPKLVTNTAEFLKLYGNIDRSLEKKGSYFHRSALVALSWGPILCLNLLNLDPDLDQVQTKTLSTRISRLNKPTVTLPLCSLYNTDKFWFASDESFQDAINTCLIGDGETDEISDWSDNILSFANIGKRPLSVLIKKANSYSSKGFELTLNEWYGEENVPEYLNGTSFVSDYLVEVYVVGGNFGPELEVKKTINSKVDIDDDNYNDQYGDILKLYKEIEGNPYKRFTSDIVYQSFFDERGFKRKLNDTDKQDSALVKFLNLPSVNLIAKYVGSLIPNFVDKMGRNLWIQKLINDDVDTVGLICTENIENIENVDKNEEYIDEAFDLIGHNIYRKIVEGRKEEGIIEPKIDFDFLSYKMNLGSEDVVQQRIFIKRDKSTSEIISLLNGDEIFEDDSEDYDDKLVDLVEYARPIDSKLDMDPMEYNAPYAWCLVGPDGKIDESKENAIYTRESVIENNGVYVYSEPDDDINNYLTDIYDFTEVNSMFVEFKKLPRTDVFYTSTNIKDSEGAEINRYIPRDNEVILYKTAKINVGDYIMSYWYNGSEIDSTDELFIAPKENFSRLSKVIEVRKVYKRDINKNTGDELDTVNKKDYYYRVICTDKIFTEHAGSDDMVVKIKPIDSFSDRLQWISLDGYKMRPECMPNGTNERQNEILDMLRENPNFVSTNSNLFKTLIDRDYIQWRYLVDTFGLGLEEECKSVYTQLCQARKSALAIINCPSLNDFKKSKDPKFTNKSNAVEVELIAQGGDLNYNPAFLYSLPTIENGASWGAYYFPYLKISDLSAVKNVPPAAYVSNLYMQKYSRSNAWSIVAGQKRGVISGNQVIGVEATLIHDNRDWLEPAGINSIIWENGVGVEVYANKTAKQSPKSALSSIHVRECCIYIQDNVESILRRYVFEYNTAQTRLEIKTLVDNFLEGVKSNYGIYDFKTVMDTSNNSQEVIDNNMGVIDIYIEAVKGLEILTQRLTVMKTGGIATGVFE